MKVFSILLAIASALAGLKGAYYWYVSSKVPIERWGGNHRCSALPLINLANLTATSLLLYQGFVLTESGRA